MKTGNYDDLEIDAVYFWEGGVKIEWTSESLGYGEIIVSKSGDGVLIDSESMSKEFVKALLDKLVEKSM